MTTMVTVRLVTGGYTIDLDRIEVFDVIAMLLRHRDRVVTKEELLDGVWGSRFVSESALTSRIKDARRALGDSVPGDEVAPEANVGAKEGRDPVYLQFGFLLWLAAATTLLCAVLARRSARVAALSEVRRRLVSESRRADERHSRQLAEQLHDGPLQNLLALRLDIEEIGEQHPDIVLDGIHSALHDTATQLRGTVTALHPQVLAELGLTAGLRELLRQFQSPDRFTIESELAEVGRPPSQSLLYRATRELLINVRKHARASAVYVRLEQDHGVITLTVTDDGTGFDPQILDRSVAGGHIGLASLLVRIDAIGGSLSFDSPPGGGTRATITVPVDAG